MTNKQEYNEDDYESPAEFNTKVRISASIKGGVVEVEVKGLKKTLVRGAKFFASAQVALNEDDFEPLLGEVEESDPVPTLTLSSSLGEVLLRESSRSCCNSPIYVYVKFSVCDSRTAKVSITDQRKKRKVVGCDVTTYTESIRITNVIKCSNA